jgi:tetratricopeptide (TPR) repeat protein
MYARSVRERSVQLVTITGEPGVGKTRLVREFRAALEERDERVTWRQGRCLPYGRGITFWALGEIVKEQAGIRESDGPDEATLKLAAEVASLVRDVNEREWFVDRLSALVGVTGSEAAEAVDRGEAFAAWRRFLEAIASRGPLVLVVEDMHWADPPLLEFLEHLGDWSTGSSVLVLCAAWPELYDRSPGWAGGKRGSTTIGLSPLTDVETTRLIAALLSEAALPAETQASLIERSGGNPLYTEQFVSMLTDRGILTRRGPVWALDTSAEIPVPGTAVALIAARLGTLPREQRLLLQTAAVFGKVFWAGGLAAVEGVNPDEVRRVLHDLAGKELVRPSRLSSVKGDWEYSFWHGLLRDVAYSQLAPEIRAEKHRSTAAWLEGIGGDRAADHAEILAHHYREALGVSGLPDQDRARLEDRAVKWFLMAGDRALQLDVDKADSYYLEALECRPPGPEQTEILQKMAGTAHLTGHFPQAESLYRRVIEERTAQGRVLEAGSAMLELAYVLWNQGETAASRDVLADALVLLEREPPGRQLAMAYTQRAADLFMAGHPKESLDWCDRALPLADRLGLPELVVRIRQIRGMNRCDLGDWDGLEDLREALRMGLELRLGQETVRSYLNLGNFLTPMEGPDRALELYRAGMGFAERRGLTYVGMWLRGWALGVLFELGRWDELVAEADEVLAWDEATGGSQLRVACLDCKAEVLACRGRLEEALALADEYLPRARAIGDPQILVPALAVAALTMELAGQTARAVPLVEELERNSREGAAWVRTLFLHVCVRVLVAEGRMELAQRLLDEADQATPRGRHSVLTGSAVVAEADGRTDEAADLYARAAEGWAEYGFGLESGRALLGHARCLRALGRAGEAAEAAVRAAAVLEPLGAEPLLAQPNGLQPGR